MTDHIGQMFFLPDAWRSPEGGSPLADREGGALRKVQEQGSAGVQGQSLAQGAGVRLRRCAEAEPRRDARAASCRIQGRAWWVQGKARSGHG